MIDFFRTCLFFGVGFLFFGTMLSLPSLGAPEQIRRLEQDWKSVMDEPRQSRLPLAYIVQGRKMARFFFVPAGLLLVLVGGIGLLILAAT
jgi:hypothetical protein